MDSVLSPGTRGSVVVPACNEEDNVRPLYDALVTVTARLGGDWEFIFVDDGSSDATLDHLQALHAQDGRVKVLQLSRNFGSHVAISAGLDHADGDFFVIMAADLQDPPEVIAQFVEQWKAGANVVWGVRETRHDPWLKRFTASLFYRLFLRTALAVYPPEGTSGFCLLDRPVLEVVRRCHEHNRMLFGLIAWSGFRQVYVSYHGGQRLSGRSKWTLHRMVKLALDAFTSFSFVPIRLMLYFGGVVSLTSLLALAGLLLYRLWTGNGGGAGEPLALALLFLGGVQMAMLGMLGEYLWRTLDETKKRPLYIVRDAIGLTERRVP